MLFYRTIVMTAMTDEVEPLLKSCVQQALAKGIGPDWYEREGRAVMQHYDDFEKIQKRIEQNIAPLDTMDLTALFFLFLPYAKEKNILFDDELVQQVAQYLNMKTDSFKGKLRRLREIRNNAIHDDCDKNVKPDAVYLQNGTQEKIWLDDIETIMANFQSSFQLTSYKVHLNRLIEQKRNETEAIPVYADQISEAEAIRRECVRIHTLDCFNGPLVSPLSGVAPWAGSRSDLDSLPWPSELNAQPMPAAPAAAPVSGTTAGQTNFSDMVNDSAAHLAERVSGGLGKFLRFLDKKN